MEPQHNKREVKTMKKLLLSYVGLMAERHAYRPGDGFEYRLWNDLKANLMSPTLVSVEEAYEICYLAVYSHSWVTFNLETGMFEVIDLDEWKALLQKRGH
jgi:hypothetical protein